MHSFPLCLISALAHEVVLGHVSLLVVRVNLPKWINQPRAYAVLALAIIPFLLNFFQKKKIPKLPQLYS